MVVDFLEQAAETIDLLWKRLRDIVEQIVEVVGEIQHAIRKRHLRLQLRTKIKVLPLHPELSEQFAERTDFRARFGVVRDCVQADVVIAIAQPVE